MKVLLTHTPQSRAQYYGARSLEGLQAIAQVKLHESSDALDAAGLIEAASEVDIIVADRLTAGPGEIFPALPDLRAVVRCAVDIRNIDVHAASAAGVLVTRAGPGFVQSVAEGGNLVDEAALSAALRGNRIAGAAMDVGRALDQMPSPELTKLPNVIATPHIGGLTPPAIESQSLETVRQVKAIIAGDVPAGAVNADYWKWRVSASQR